MNKISKKFIKGNFKIFKLAIVIISMFMSLLMISKISENVINVDIENQYSFFRGNEIIPWGEFDDYNLSSNKMIKKTTIYVGRGSTYKNDKNIPGQREWFATNDYYICDDFKAIEAILEKPIKFININDNDGIYVSKKMLDLYLNDKELVIHVGGIDIDFQIKGYFESNKSAHLLDIVGDVNDNNEEYIFMTRSYFDSVASKNEDYGLYTKFSYLYEKDITEEEVKELSRRNNYVTIIYKLYRVIFQKEVYKIIIDNINNLTLFLVLMSLAIHFIMMTLVLIETKNDRINMNILGINNKNRFLLNLYINIYTLLIPYILMTLSGIIMYLIYKFIYGIDTIYLLATISLITLLIFVILILFYSIIMYLTDKKLLKLRK